MTGGPLVDHRGRPRVAVTGVGLVTPAGDEPDAFWRQLVSGESTARELDRFDASAVGLELLAACQIKGFDPTPYMPHKDIRQNDLFAQYALVAAVKALRHAGAPASAGGVHAVVSGSACTAMETWTAQAVAYHEGGPRRMAAMAVPRLLPNAPAQLIARLTGRQGPCVSIGTSSASGTTAIGEGARLIRDGGCDTVLAGASEAPLVPMGVAGLTRLGVLSTRHRPALASRPFDLDRDGLVLSEGAAFLHLERLDHALDRGADVLAEIGGYAQTCDAHHVVAPRPDAAAATACITATLRDAGLDPADVGYVKAHGTSTALNDLTEALALRQAFPQGPPPVTAPKGVLGHSLGAAGAVEAAAAVLSLRHGTIPPVATYRTPDPECGLDIVTSPRPARPAPVLCNSFGFGGHNACLIVGPHTGVGGAEAA
ncbi:beta-ketoacyl-[acyl-carrier-protein] synthase family protein [Streptomyces huiliensis]|uniref:beta-ketoacyl-[acyl-carrier-protein] synthase family protein n=1 Tax=Streptomyces huiliensis TaxID=2876027 RepID=UPI001CBEE9EA|nr:beta-ketoacyl-[acyl-carrier-protein] synthase family protein [Streptomyces huiliensis]MBZ4321059.1 beta-ketoacyl-[acyl-carrier-protein] synthase family protein [Streptomyces huiliensis]